MSSSRKYIGLFTKTPQEYYQKPTEKQQTDNINKSLVALRRKFLDITKDDKKLSFKLLHFQKVVHSKDIDKVVDTIRYFLKADEMGVK